ncbi:MAG: sulfite exporter TauE/SafE family protein [Thermoproteales archaeon]|nr:sulfite exporter TauE/SafE family protein [Thermoproteales archaeon]
MSPLDIVLLLLTGLAAGTCGALMGIGGGVIMVPVLTAFFAIPVKEAAAASLVTVIATSMAGSSRYLKQRMVNIRLAFLLETVTSLGAITGALLTILVPPYILYFILSVLLGYLALQQFKTRGIEEEKIRHMGYKNVKEDKVARILKLASSYYDLAERTLVEYNISNTGVGLIASFFAGVLSAMLGIGGGVLKVSFMNQLMNTPIKAAIATSKFMIDITASTGAIIYYITGIVNLAIVAPMVLGVTSGAIMGATVMNKIKSRRLKTGFALLLAYLSYLMLRKGIYIYTGMLLPGP